MNLNLKKYLAFSSVTIFMLSACHSGQKDSSAAADSANQKQIALTDSANKAQASSADSSNKAKTSLQKDASKFLVDSYESGMYEIQLSQLAKANALDIDVKNLADSLINAHKAINSKIYAIAASANFVLPAAINANHQKDLMDITKVTGAKFDKQFVNTVISGHEKSVSNYKDAYKNLQPGDTRNFAAEMLPKIENHLVMAKRVQERIK